MSAQDTALIVIDVQESFRQRAVWQDDIARPFIRNVQALIDGAAKRNIPVVQILHTDNGVGSGWGGRNDTPRPRGALSQLNPFGF